MSGNNNGNGIQSWLSPESVKTVGFPVAIALAALFALGYIGYIILFEHTVKIDKVQATDNDILFNVVDIQRTQAEMNQVINDNLNKNTRATITSCRAIVKAYKGNPEDCASNGSL